MPLSEHNAPGFYYQVKWRRRDSSSAANRNREYSERTFTGNVSQMTIYDQPIYKAYEIYVLALNSIGEAVSPPKMYIGFSSEDSKYIQTTFNHVSIVNVIYINKTNIVYHCYLDIK